MTTEEREELNELREELDERVEAAENNGTAETALIGGLWALEMLEERLGG